MTGRGRRGSVQQAGNGTWYFVVDVYDESGHRRQTRRRGFATRRAAQSALTATLTNLETKTYVAPTRQLLRAYLEEEWLPAVKVTVRPSTYDSYMRLIRLHVAEEPIARRALQDIDGPHLNALYARLLTPKPEGHGLGPRTVQYVHVVLHRAFRDAIRWGRVARNPCDLADPPRSVARPRTRTWTGEQLGAFLDASADDRLYGLWHLIATTGMRRGEALGLDWANVDLDAARINVVRTLIQVADYRADGTDWAYGTPKTAKGYRSISLDAGTVAALRAHRARQLEERLLLGPDYNAGEDLVFSRPDGSPHHPKLVSQQFRRLVRRHGFPPLSVHGLRHTWATLALQSGVHPKIVQERLGHAQVAVTLDIYSHVNPAMDAAAADLVAGLIIRG